MAEKLTPVERKNRRWTIWAVHLAAFLISAGAFGSLPSDLGAVLIKLWFGVLVWHTVVLVQDNEVEWKRAMRSEAEIRKHIEDHLKRRGLWVVDAGLWLLAVFVFRESMLGGYSTTVNYLATLFMLAWMAALGAHTLRTVYVELRDYLVNRALEREQHYYVMEDGRSKRKRNEARPRLAIDDDGELVDFLAEDEEESYAQRSRDS